MQVRLHWHVVLEQTGVREQVSLLMMDSGPAAPSAPAGVVILTSRSNASMFAFSFRRIHRPEWTGAD
ncbi:hypothetical protein M8C13_16255 [Crossiella sp. SN42]|uniref:hypothetical protein n=1 Tax=Crossiella sp. SN42 TaxID=2944808 RepID=UPI00207D1B72|nr:hypothetical protein [Crossiella sp. SN42]MCO1577310.1 hypothetical protein [Crossiella sp. SN42]